jgi:DNA-binding GntR family transcriptional regulator
MIKIDDAFQTSAQKAYEIITQGILTNVLTPGQKLTRKAMADLTGVSTISVMEALHILEREGLVESRPHYGSHVVRMTPAIMKDRYELREAIECHVVRILSKSIAPGQVDNLLRLGDELDRMALADHGSVDFWEKHGEFHLMLAELTGCESLVESLRKTSLFILLQTAHMAVRLTSGPPENHAEVVRAIASRDADFAEKVMREHIERYWSAVGDLVATRAREQTP